MSLFAMAALTLADGSVIDLDGHPSQGTRHRVLRGRLRETGERVIVKVELVSGALEVERLALVWVGDHGVRVPRLITESECPLMDAPARCLVIEAITGEAPETTEEWNLLGRGLASLAAVPVAGSPLRIEAHDAFLAAHEARIRDLGRPALEALGGAQARQLPTSAPVSGCNPLVVTHGDPGPGNFLVTAAGGVLLDWEEAHVAPRGLDLARSVFIALAGVGPEGYAGREHAERARAVAAGYLAAVDWRPDAAELRWWLTVAGIQFAHRRWERRGQARVLPWQDALTVLRSALLSDEWMPDAAGRG